MSMGSRSLPAPTAEQKRRWADAREKGCIAGLIEGGDCSGVLEQHHLKSGNLRMGHWFTVCLCAGHHARAAGLSKVYGNERLMLVQDRLLGYKTPRIRERNRKSKCTRSDKTLPNNIWTRESAEGTN